MSAFGGPNIITDGLVLSLDAGNVKSYHGSGTIWYDKSGNRNNGTLTNGPTFNSANGGSIVFDGTNDYVSLNSTITLNYNKTFIFWVNLDGVEGSEYHLINLSTGNDYRDRVFISANQLDIYWGEGSNDIITFNFSENILNKNKQIGYMTDNTSMYLIEDGVITQQTSVSFPNGDRVYQVLGGQSSGSGVLWYKGKISYFQHYNKFLTDSEVLQNYNATKSRFNIT